MKESNLCEGFQIKSLKKKNNHQYIYLSYMERLEEIINIKPNKRDTYLN